jgi:hypothetical protein
VNKIGLLPVEMGKELMSLQNNELLSSFPVVKRDVDVDENGEDFLLSQDH